MSRNKYALFSPIAKGGKSLITVSSEVAVGMAAVQSSIEATAQLQQNADKLEKLGKKTK